MPQQSLLQELWAQQSVWSQAADRIKKSIGTWRAVLLALTIAAALFATLSAAAAAAVGWLSPALAVAAAICVGLLPAFRPRATGKILQDWTGVRAASEALKAEIYLYLARVGDYAGPDRDLTLAQTAEQIEDVASGLLPYLIGIEPKKRDLPRVSDPKSYFAVRVAEQVDVYFKSRIKRLTETLRRFKVVEVALTISAVVLGALAATFGEAGLSPWIAVLTTTTAAVAARSAAGSYDFQLVEYLRATAELHRVRGAAHRTTDPAELSRLVRRSEQILTIQNQGWLAKLSTDPGPEPGAA